MDVTSEIQVYSPEHRKRQGDMIAAGKGLKIDLPGVFLTERVGQPCRDTTWLLPRSKEKVIHEQIFEKVHTLWKIQIFLLKT